jgi:hypothetical protein
MQAGLTADPLVAALLQRGVPSQSHSR